jgi:hypothetical protein
MSTTTVPDSIRREYQEERAVEKADRGATYASRLRAGETLFFDRPTGSFGTYCPMARRHGMRVITRRAVVEGVRGTLVWLEPAP